MTPSHGCSRYLCIALHTLLAACSKPAPQEQPPAPSASTQPPTPPSAQASQAAPLLSATALPGTLDIRDAPPPGSPESKPCENLAPGGKVAFTLPPGPYLHGVDASTRVPWLDISQSSFRFAYVQAKLGQQRNAVFADNWAMAKRCQLLRGAYDFITPKLSGAEQAKTFLETVGPDRGELPLSIDVELPPGCKGPCCAVSCDGWATVISDWLKTVRAATNAEPMLYTVEPFWKECLCNSSRFAESRLWLAGYPRFDLAPRPGFGGWQRWLFYQHKGNARIGEGVVDLDVFAGDASALRDLIIAARR